MTLADLAKQVADIAKALEGLQQPQQPWGQQQQQQQYQQQHGKGGGKGTGKGGGKGGKSQGKGNPPMAASRREPAWGCVPCWEEGRPGSKDKNLGWRTHCRLCNRGKAKALVSAPYRQNAPSTTWDAADYQVGLSSKARKSAARREKKEAAVEEQRQAQAAAPSPPGGGGAGGAGGQGNKPVDATQKFVPTTDAERAEPPVVDVPHYGIKTLVVMKEPKYTFTWPAKESKTQTPQEEVEAHKVCKASEGLIAAREREATYQATLEAAQDPPTDPNHHAATVLLLKNVKVEIKGYTGQYVGGRAAIEEMQTQRQKLTTTHTAATERTENSLALAKGRYDAMEAQFHTQLKEIQRRLTLFQTSRVEVLQAFAKDTAERETRYQETKEVWSQKIADMESRIPAANVTMEAAPAPAAEVAVAPPAVVPPVVVTVTPAVTELSQEVKEYHLSAPWTPMDLPASIPTPKAGEFEFWVTLAQHAQVWREQHACAPCTYAELMEVQDVSAGMASIVSIIGAEYWTKLYGQRMVLATDVVPCQLALVLQQALLTTREAAETGLGEKATEESMTKAKATVKAHMADAGKRPKIKLVRKKA